MIDWKLGGLKRVWVTWVPLKVVLLTEPVVSEKCLVNHLPIIIFGLLFYFIANSF